MRIVCYFINYNDSFYLPFFHQHYSQFCERIVMFDQYSTDDSKKIAVELGIEVRNFGRPGQLNDQWYLDVKNNCWKECRGQGIDYIIVVDIDEFLVLPNCLTGTFPRVLGYNMISNTLPVNDIREINTGAFNEQYSKQAIFNPDAIEEINYVHGCHVNNAIGDMDRTDGKTCRLYHYRDIGGVERKIERHAMYRQRMSEFNKKHQMGFHYNHSDAAKREEWRYLQENAKELW